MLKMYTFVSIIAVIFPFPFSIGLFFFLSKFAGRDPAYFWTSALRPCNGPVR